MIKKQFIVACILLFALVTACTITRTFDIQKQTIEQLQTFYKTNKIENFFVAKDLKQFQNLGKIGKLAIPANTVFDKDGVEIVTFDEKLCSNHTLMFLRNYNSSLNFKNGTLTIDEYLKNFDVIGKNTKTSDEIKKSSNVRVFLNTATYGNIGGLGNPNKEAMAIYEEFGNKYDIYFINVDYLIKWDDK